VRQYYDVVMRLPMRHIVTVSANDGDFIGGHHGFVVLSKAELEMLHTGYGTKASVE